MLKVRSDLMATHRPPPPSLLSYQYGYRDPAASFRSILAYNCASGECDSNAGGGCTRVQMFSQPNYLYNGAAIGTATEDNARKINDEAATVAAYYESATRSAPTPAPSYPEPTPAPSAQGQCTGAGLIHVTITLRTDPCEPAALSFFACTYTVPTARPPDPSTYLPHMHRHPHSATAQPPPAIPPGPF